MNEKYIFNQYLVYLLASQFFQSQLRLIESQTTRNFVSITKQYNLFLIIPSLDEQKLIVEKIDELFSKADKVGNLIQSELIRATSLRQSILKHAFEGRLVPQDPNDEPASFLLERIKSEKSKPKKLK